MSSKVTDSKSSCLEDEVVFDTALQPHAPTYQSATATQTCNDLKLKFNGYITGDCEGTSLKKGNDYAYL